MSAIVGPIAPENNPPINPQYYQPSQFFISALGYGLSTTVTTTANNNYVIGQLIRLLIPFACGANILNEQTGYVTAINSTTQFVVAINSTNADPFNASPSGKAPTLPQVVAVGDINSGQINANGRNSNITFINGSFINISPI